ncbi:MAG TPA: ATPase domain-containing protein, partial [Verrucomicrobiae bacterium]|nr:ATPase domain-containing protein [Verrucomicrobiae bacterium]
MAKSRTVFICQTCGATAPKWSGQCSDCGEWNTLVEGIAEKSTKAMRGPGASGVRRLSEVSVEDAPRIATGTGELDRVLGGGLVPGAVILIGGDPGIGKSTLLLQLLGAVQGKFKALYVTGEESLSQVSLRAHRLGLKGLDLPVLAETNVEQVLTQLSAEKPGLAVIDSIQTLYTDSLDSAPGSVSQLRECAAQLVRHAKASGCCVILVGHVTKEGAIAGPRVLEHMVDTVLYF